jgi:hypothetical protein
MYYDEQEFDNTMAQWMTTKRFTSDASVNTKIRQRVLAYLQNGGAISVTHFERAYLELLAQGEIPQFKQTVNAASAAAAAPVIPPEVAAYIENPRTSAFEMRKRYANDPVFRKQYDAYETAKLKDRVAQEEASMNVTPEDVRKMTAQETRQRYHRDSKFRALIDRWIAEGKVI